MGNNNSAVSPQDAPFVMVSKPLIQTPRGIVVVRSEKDLAYISPDTTVLVQTQQ